MTRADVHARRRAAIGQADAYTVPFHTTGRVRNGE
jgi:hypothetical protein